MIGNITDLNRGKYKRGQLQNDQDVPCPSSTVVWREKINGSWEINVTESPKLECMQGMDPSQNFPIVL